MNKEGWYYVIILTVLVTIIWYLIKKYTLTHKNLFLYVSIIVYGSFPLFIASAIRSNNLAVINLLYGIFSSITVILLSYFVFMEPLTNTQRFGILLFFISSILIADVKILHQN